MKAVLKTVVLMFVAYGVYVGLVYLPRWFPKFPAPPKIPIVHPSDIPLFPKPPEPTSLERTVRDAAKIISEGPRPEDFLPPAPPLPRDLNQVPMPPGVPVPDLPKFGDPPSPPIKAPKIDIPPPKIPDPPIKDPRKIKKVEDILPGGNA